MWGISAGHMRESLTCLNLRLVTWSSLTLELRHTKVRFWDPADFARPRAHMTTTGHMTMTDLCISDTCTCFPPSVSNAFVSVLAALAIASPNSPDSLSRHQ